MAFPEASPSSGRAHSCQGLATEAMCKVSSLLQALHLGPSYNSTPNASTLHVLGETSLMTFFTTCRKVTPWAKMALVDVHLVVLKQDPRWCLPARPQPKQETQVSVWITSKRKTNEPTQMLKVRILLQSVLTKRSPLRHDVPISPTLGYILGEKQKRLSCPILCLTRFVAPCCPTLLPHLLPVGKQEHNLYNGLAFSIHPSSVIPSAPHSWHANKHEHHLTNKVNVKRKH